MSVYKVDICGVTTSKLPVLKDDENEELFEKIKKGDKAAREKYIRGNLRLVLSVIRRFSNHNENMDDLRKLYEMISRRYAFRYKSVPFY